MTRRKGRASRSATVLTAALFALASACSAGDDAPSGTTPPGPTLDGGIEGAANDAAGCELTLCSGACVNTFADTKNCGSCGHVCNSIEACRGGVCVVACPEGQEACGDRCLDIRTDPKSCGACGRECPTGQSCGGGACLCADTNLVSCEGACLDPKKDESHCGAVAGCGQNAGYSGSACTSNGYCGDGVCRTCTTWSAGQAINVVANPTALAIADFNGDSVPDLAVAEETPCCAASAVNQVTIFLGLAGGTFRATGASYPSGKQPVALATGDVNADGKLDIVSADWTGRGVTIFVGNGDGTFRPQTVTLEILEDPNTGYEIYPFPRGVAIGDFNADGRGDIVVAGGVLRVLLSNTDGTFTAQHYWDIDASEVTVVDMNGDGKADLVTLGGGLSGTTVALGDGAGHFAVAQHAGTQSGGGNALHVVDADGDGKLDILVDGESWFHRLYRGIGGGGFEPAPVHIPFAAVPASNGEGITDVHLRDVTGDGVLDLVTSTMKGKVYVRAGAGGGAYHPAETVLAGTSVQSLRVVDLDGDTRADFVVADHDGKKVRIWSGARSSAVECQ